MGTIYPNEFGYDDIINFGCDASAARATRKLKLFKSVISGRTKVRPFGFSGHCPP